MALNKTRPRLATASEVKFADIEKRSAKSYTELEKLADDLKKLADDLDNDAVPIETDAWEDNSLVHNVETLHRQTGD